jgi:PAS domain S-box-containing protein
VPGLTVEDVIGKTVYDYIPKIHHNIVKESLQEVARTGKNSSYELEGIGPHGTKAWYSTKVGPIKDQGRIVALMQITSDITERREAEKKIKVALGEKEMLLKEIHHRIKNNLQVITSLLNLQSRYIKNKEDKDMFKHAQNRIKTMALVHEKLYGSQDFMYIDFKEYIHSLSNHLFSSYVSSSKIDLRITVENVLLDIDTAIPCSLIINELVTNSIKYAFPNSKKGRISIALNMRKKEYVLIVADNGKGLPENFDYRKTESLGLQLVCALTEQLHGKITLGKNKGTEFTITFRKK